MVQISWDVTLDAEETAPYPAYQMKDDFFIEAKYHRKENKTAEALLTICESLECNIQDFITRILIKYDKTVKQKG